MHHAHVGTPSSGAPCDVACLGNLPSRALRLGQRISNIDYIQINSMSYFWMGRDYQYIRCNAKIDKEYPWIKYTAPYRDPLFASITLNANGIIRIEGTQSEWVGPSPSDLGYTKDKDNRIVPVISSRRLEPQR